MFRKEYKEANDSIKIDEALIEKTIESAFREDSGKRVFKYKYISPLAAALVVVIGASVAYPKLIHPPVTETSYTDVALTQPPAEPEPTVTAVETAVPETVTEVVPESTPAKKTPSVNKKNITPVKTESPSVKKEIPVPKPTEPVYEPVPEKLPEYPPVQKQVPIHNNPVEEMNTAPEYENNTAEAGIAMAAVGADEMTQYESQVIPDARAYTGETDDSVAFDPEVPTADGFELSATKFMEDGSVVYVYDNGEGKSFTVTENTDKTYTFESENMTQEEMAEAYKSLN